MFKVILLDKTINLLIGLRTHLAELASDLSLVLLAQSQLLLLLVESQSNDCEITVGFLKIVLVGASLTLNCCNRLLDFVRISLMSISHRLKSVQALSFVGLQSFLQLLHALVEDLTFISEVLFLLFLAASKLSLNFLEMCFDSVFVILTYEVYKTVNLVQICIKVVKSIFEVRLKENNFIPETVVCGLEVAKVLKCFLCSGAFRLKVNFKLIDFLPLTSDCLLKSSLNLCIPILLVVELLSNSSNFLT